MKSRKTLNPLYPQERTVSPARFRLQSLIKLGLCTVAILVCVLVAMAQPTSELFGWVKYNNQSPAEGVVLTLGNYSVATDKDGHYRIPFLRPGPRKLLIAPPGKETRSRDITIEATATRVDVNIDW
jgi:hypothetical protein